eukprot:541791-Pelagomonas_calceolata.AAC.1
MEKMCTSEQPPTLRRKPCLHLRFLSGLRCVAYLREGALCVCCLLMPRVVPPASYPAGLQVWMDARFPEVGDEPKLL